VPVGARYTETPTATVVGGVSVYGQERTGHQRGMSQEVLGHFFLSMFADTCDICSVAGRNQHREKGWRF
jgi:hypothetical protein